MTAVETAKAVGLSNPRARQIIKELRDSGRLRVEEVSSGRGRARLVYHAGPNGTSSGAGTAEAAAAATGASSSASSTPSTHPRSVARRGTSTRKRSSPSGRTRASGAAAKAAQAQTATDATA
jgi:predicted ArsR family transcriptional regulator